jgi:sugar/nucleoside kinase (ribokinase family)
VAAIVGPDGDRSLVTDIHDDVTLRATDYTPRWFDGVGWLHLTGYTFILAASRSLFQLLTAEAAGRRIPYSIDPSAAELLRSCSGRAEVLAAFSGAELLLPSHDEAAYLTGTADPATAAEQLLSLAACVAVTCGPDGAHVAQRGRPTFHLPAEPVTSPNALGCGDAFAGGFVAGLLAGRTTQDAARQAVLMATRAARLPSAR